MVYSNNAKQEFQTLIQLDRATNPSAHTNEPLLPSSQESIEPSQSSSSANVDSLQRPYATTTAVEFLDHLKNETEADEIGKHINDIFGSFCNLAHSFQIPIQADAAEAMEIDQSPPTPKADDTKIDWDGLKRVYDEIESQSALELVLIQARDSTFFIYQDSYMSHRTGRIPILSDQKV